MTCLTFGLLFVRVTWHLSTHLSGLAGGDGPVLLCRTTTLIAYINISMHQFNIRTSYYHGVYCLLHVDSYSKQ